MAQRLKSIAIEYRQKVFLLISVMMIFFIIGAISLYQLRQSIAILDQNYGTSVFSMFQVKLELRRFYDSLSLYRAAPGPQHFDEVNKRYNLLWSRFPVLMEGEDGKRIRNVENAENTLVKAFETVKSLDDSIVNRLATEPEYSTQIQQTLLPEIDALDGLALQNFYRTNAIINSNDSRVISLQQQLILLMSGIIFIGIMLLLMIIRESRLNRHQAEHDSLTGIPNRAFLKREITRYCEKKKPFALHLIDLNGFKDVNDTLGHHIGDTLLQSVSDRLAQDIDQPYGCLTCRLGGDEFAIIQPAIRSSNSLNIIADKIIQLFEQQFTIDQHTCFIGASIGTVLYPEHGTDVGSLMTRADIAMYKAKEQAVNSRQMLFNFDMDVQINRRQKLHTDLREALEHKKLQLVYQPIVDLKNPRVAGLEALLRWNHETYGAIPPLEIIEIAEKYSLANDLGKWVIAETCRQLQEWRSGGFKPLPVAINISPSMHQLDLAGIINKSLEQYDLPKGLIRIEVTEDTSMRILKETQDMLPGLNRHNISIALDDFGTGLSSLSHLQQFPIQTLKIDRSFISKITADHTSSRLVKNIIGIGHDLGMKVVAEGIEDSTAVELLIAYQCDYGQGYLFSKPLAPQLIPDCCRQLEATSAELITYVI